ncbi:MAG TPA: complex I subunit 1 family protein [Coriobacteriia bacterium]|nr:complex I subunit 1 family protein [Coriobacteriia bacterium]
MSGLVWGAVFGFGAASLIAFAALVGVWAERKVSARIQMRIGPQELGPFGLFQTFSDTVKLVLKEDITPARVDVRAFRLAPFVVFAPVAASLVVIPYATGFAPLDMSVGVFFFLAVPGLSVLGVLLAGWASRNTYATIGGLRAAAQMISYELPRTLSVLPVVMLAGSMRPLDIVDEWRWWWIPLTAISFAVYFISSIAELNRGPFDLPEAESELVAGYFADYSGIRWAVFMMAEYGAMLAAGLFAAAVFFGGAAHLPGVGGTVVLAGTGALIAIAMMWVKWTFPRMRPDQLMGMAWKVLTPLALFQIAVVGAVIPWL